MLSNLGVKRAMVVHGHDGLDEATLCTSTTVCEVGDGRINSFFLDPRQFGFETCRPEDLVGGGPEENAEIARRILAGGEGAKTRYRAAQLGSVPIYGVQSAHAAGMRPHGSGYAGQAAVPEKQMERFVQLTRIAGHDAVREDDRMILDALAESACKRVAEAAKWEIRRRSAVKPLSLPPKAAPFAFERCSGKAAFLYL